MLKCLICKKYYKHLGSHIWHGHKMFAREYKKKFGLPYNMALIDDNIKAKKQFAFNKRRKFYLDNIKESGKKNQFKKGRSGIRRISKIEKENIIKRINKVNSQNKVFKNCPVCNIKYKHLESHLYNKHKLLRV